ncbi:enoyl-ACP reductase FabI [Mailhella sp.]|uniref:enoyl-ACP reductase FabI n=1 Tax=Mailhella sp. TaxID=1981029 RepID=UPI004063765B
MLLEGKKAAIFGVANNRSIAYGIASAFKREGAQLCFSYLGDSLKKRVEPICEELGGDFTFPCDVASDDDITRSAEIVAEKWGKLDILVHSVAFANRDDLKGRFIDTSRDGFKLAMDISAYSLVGLARAFAPLLNPGASIICMTYYGSQKVITNYNVMGVAKAALEASVRYLAKDFGPANIRVNAISAGPIRTLAASGIGDFHQIGSLFSARAPLGRLVTIEEVGNTAAFLASDHASAITGECLFVDGGFQSVAL